MLRVLFEGTRIVLRPSRTGPIYLARLQPSSAVSVPCGCKPMLVLKVVGALLAFSTGGGQGNDDNGNILKYCTVLYSTTSPTSGVGRGEGGGAAPDARAAAPDYCVKP